MQSVIAANAAQKKLDDDQSAFEARIATEIDALKKSQSGSSGLTLADRAALDQVIESQKQLAARLSTLEGALINEPAKALAVPLLKKDVD